MNHLFIYFAFQNTIKFGFITYSYESFVFQKIESI